MLLLIKKIKYIPFFRWLKWIKMVYCLTKKYKTIQIGYNSFINCTTLGGNNSFGINTQVNNCEIGSYTYLANNCIFNNTIIGRFCSVGSNVISGHGRHPSSVFVSTSPTFFSTLKQNGVTFVDKNYFDELLPVIIGNDVWIGANVFIRDGIKIGNGAIVGAGAVVTKDVPPFAIVGGVPAKIIKYRFTPEEISLLEEDAWWYKNSSFLKKNAKKFQCITDYIEYIKNRK